MVACLTPNHTQIGFTGVRSFGCWVTDKNHFLTELPRYSYIMRTCINGTATT
jgi:hypothetical protein